MRWINATQLGAWGRSPASEEELPLLVSDLIRGSSNVITDLRIPVGDKSNIRGFDGWLVSETASRFIPAGESVWEFGTDKNAKRKVQQDYADRTESTDLQRRQTLTLVLVTPQTPDDPKVNIIEWLADKRTAGDWKDVKILDGTALEDWLDEQPAVAARWARTFGVAPDGVRSTDQFWEEYGQRFERPLNEDVVLSGRADSAVRLVQSLQDQAGPITLQADSPDEVVAFAVAAIRSAEPETRLLLEARTLVVDTEQAGQALYQRRRGGVFLPRSNASSTTRQLAANGPTLVAISADQPNRGHEVLERPSSHDLAKALETIGLTDHQASRVAHECGRSLTVLERTFAAPSGAVSPPDWRSRGDKLMPALMAVSWDAASAGDREIVSALGQGRPYEDLERDFRGFVNMVDPPLEIVGSAWKLRAPVDAFVWLADQLGTDDLDRIRTAALTVLGVVEPDPNPDDVFDLTRPPPKYSGWLRSGLVTTILQIAALHGPARLTIHGQTPQAWVDDLVASIRGLREDHRVIGSLRDRLPYLMEAAPLPLLAALEHLLEGDKLTPIFDEIDTGLSPYSRHTGLLFALETLAWDPLYLNRVCDILCRLSVIDPGGRLGNRPSRSLREILLPWSPNTYASDEQRFAALEVVLKRDATIGWELALALLPRDHDISTPTSKPRFREAGENDAVGPTYASLAVFYTRLARKVIELAQQDSGRLAELAPKVERLGGEPWVEALTAFDAFLSRASEAERAPVWTALRSLRDRHRRFASADWALPSEQLAQLEALVSSYAPPAEKDDFGDLFDDWFPMIEGQADPDEDAILDARRKAVAGILRSPDASPRLVALAAKSKLAWSVGQAAALELPDTGAITNLLQAALDSPAGPQRDLAAALANGARLRFPQEWPAALRNWILTYGVAAIDVARLVYAWPETNETWDFVHEFGADVEAAYWSGKASWRIKAGEDADLNRAIEAYVGVGRPAAALEAAMDRLGEISGERILTLIDGYLDQINKSEAETLDGMATYRLQLIFEHLDKSDDVPLDAIAKREFAMLPLLQHSKRPLALYGLMASSGVFYASVLDLVFPPDAADGLTEDEKKRRRDLATLAYRLLSEFKAAPGTDSKGSGMTRSSLETWIAEVRSGNSMPDRESLFDVYIGHALAHTPHDDDGGWPHQVVRDTLEALAAPDIERGISTERINMRGVYTKLLFEGGRQERDLAATYRAWRDLAAAWPRTSALLETIAKRWDLGAEDADIRAKQDMMRD